MGRGGEGWERIVDNHDYSFFQAQKILLMLCKLSFLSLIKKREMDRVKISEQFLGGLKKRNLREGGGEIDGRE